MEDNHVGPLARGLVASARYPLVRPVRSGIMVALGTYLATGSALFLIGTALVLVLAHRANPDITMDRLIGIAPRPPVIESSAAQFSTIAAAERLRDAATRRTRDTMRIVAISALLLAWLPALTVGRLAYDHARERQRR